MKSYKYLLLIVLIVMSFLNLNIAETDIKIESFSTKPENTATSSNGKCSGIEASFTLSERPADFSNVSVYVTGVASKSLKIDVDSTGKIYTLSGIELYEGSSLSFGNFNIKLNEDVLSLNDDVTSPTLTCSSTSTSTSTDNSGSDINPPNLNDDPPTKVTLISTANSYDVAKDGLCSQVSITFTLDSVADPTTLSITSESIDTSKNVIKITQPDATQPNYVADFDVKEDTTLSDLSIAYQGTPLTITTKLNFECKKSGSGSSSESSLLSINIVLILSSLFLYIVLFN